eukprot:3535307-Karenia_brevis.AAC.1
MMMMLMMMMMMMMMTMMKQHARKTEQRRAATVNVAPRPNLPFEHTPAACSDVPPHEPLANSLRAFEI